MSAATVVQVLQDLFLSFIACFILLVIAPLLTERVPDDGHHGRGAAHFLASFIAVVIYRVGQKKVNPKCSTHNFVKY